MIDGLEREKAHSNVQDDVSPKKKRVSIATVPSNSTNPTSIKSENPSSSFKLSHPDSSSISKTETLTDKYVLLEVLGVGSTSTCHRCLNKSTNVSYACKIIDKRHIEQRFRGLLQQFYVEIEALKALDHPNIISLEDVYVTTDKIYMVMELMEGGELFDYVVEKGTLTEEEASEMVRKITSAVVYMHKKNIIHRDMKPENLLLTRNNNNTNKSNNNSNTNTNTNSNTNTNTNNNTPEVKIIDFGLSKFLQNEPTARSFLGTRGYLAPEMLQRRDYDKAVDIWALGVIVFVLLCGCLPFDDDSTAVPTDEVVKEKFVLRFPRWAKNLSESAKDLLMHLLDCNPKTRYTADQAMLHPWVKGKSVKKDNFLQSPRIIKTPMTGNRNAKNVKNRVAELVSGRRKENTVNASPQTNNRGGIKSKGGGKAGGSKGNVGNLVRKNSI